MQTVFINSKLKKVRINLILLYLLNVVDLIFTFAFMKTGLFLEFNPLMNTVMQNAFSTALIKCILPALLFSFLYIRIKKATIRQLSITNIMIRIVLVFYVVINVMHLISFSFFKLSGIL